MFRQYLHFIRQLFQSPRSKLPVRQPLTVEPLESRAMLAADDIGVVRNANFFLDANSDQSWSGVSGGDIGTSFGSQGDVPIVGDWNGDEVDELAVFRNGVFLIDFNGNHAWNGPNNGDRVYSFGGSNDVPVAGDWNGNGSDSIGVKRGARFYLDVNGNGVWNGIAGGDQIIEFGSALDRPIVGDWNGDGKDEIGIHRLGRFYLDANGNGRWDGVGGGDQIHQFGNAQDLALAGDWNNDGFDEIGVFRNGTFYLDANRNGIWNGVNGGDRLTAFGGTNDIGIAGVWQNQPACSNAVTHVDLGVEPSLLTTLDSETVQLAFSAPQAGSNNSCGLTPTRTVSVAIDGPLAQMYRPNGVGVQPGAWTLRPGDAELQFNSVQLSFAELMNANPQYLTSNGRTFFSNVLLGTKITIRDELTNADGSQIVTTRVLNPYLFIDATDTLKTDKTITIAPTAKHLDIVRAVPLRFNLGSQDPSKVLGLANANRGFTLDTQNGAVQYRTNFSTFAAQQVSTSLVINEPQLGKFAGAITLEVLEVPVQLWNIDRASFDRLMFDMVLFPNRYFNQGGPNNASILSLIDTPFERDFLYNSIVAKTTEILGSLGNGIAQGPGGIVGVVRNSSIGYVNNCGNWVGGQFTSGFDIRQASIVNLYNNQHLYNPFELGLRLAQFLNFQATGSVELYIDNYLEFRQGLTFGSLVDSIAGLMAHESGHAIGLLHTRELSPFSVVNCGTNQFRSMPNGANDIMAHASQLRSFNLSRSAGRIATNGNYTYLDTFQALQYYRDHAVFIGAVNNSSGGHVHDHDVHQVIESSQLFVMPPKGAKVLARWESTASSNPPQLPARDIDVGVTIAAQSGVTPISSITIPAIQNEASRIETHLDLIKLDLTPALGTVYAYLP